MSQGFRVTHTGQSLDTFQEMRFALEGGGPGGMEVVFQTSKRGAEIKIWDPFNHQWITVTPDSFTQHGDTRR